MDTRATPYAPTNLTGLDALACAAYSSHALTPRTWEDLSDHERERWCSIVGYVLDIALPPGAHDAGQTMAQIRADAIGARAIARRQHEEYSESVALQAALDGMGDA